MAILWASRSSVPKKPTATMGELCARKREHVLPHAAGLLKDRGVGDNDVVAVAILLRHL